MRKHKLKTGARIFIIISLVLISTFGIWYIIDQNTTKVRKVITSELGDPLTIQAEDFFIHLSKTAAPEFITDLKTIDTKQLGTHVVVIKLKDKEYTSELSIVDTIAPTVEVRLIKLEVDTILKPEDLIISIEDQQSTTVEFKKTPTLSKVGSTTVELTIRDASGNERDVKVPITIVFDLTGPVIDASKTLYVKVGSSTVDYWKYVSTSDAKSTVGAKTIDASKVKLKQVGDYTVTLTASDSEGNVSSVSRKVSVVIEPTYFTMEAIANPESKQLDVYVQAIFDQIIKPTMTLNQKTRAIYDWMLDELTYRTDSATAYETDAYNYINDYAEIVASTYSGHCFHYAAIAGLLLNKLGLDVTMVKGEGYSSTSATHFVLHFWIMVKVDGKYYHFDPLYQHLFQVKQNKTINFYMVRTSDIYEITHQWDKAYYPVTP